MIAPLLALLLAQPAADPLVDKGFDHFYNLEYPQALAAFRTSLARDPSDPARHNHVAQAVLFQMMLRCGALESHLVTGANPFLRHPKMEPTAEERSLFLSAIASSMELTTKALAAEANDTDALYARGVAFSLRGTYNFLVTRAWMDSLRDVTESRKLHNRVTDLDPKRIDAYMAQGFHDYIVGSLHWSYRLLGFLAGFRGNKTEGIRTLAHVAEYGNLNRSDAQILLSVAYRREGQFTLVPPILESLLKRYPRNYLLLLELSQVHADIGDLAKATAALDRCEQLKKSGALGFANLPQERIEYARGNLLFWYNQPEQAIIHLRAATAGHTRLDPYSGSMAWFRLGQCLDLAGRNSEARATFRTTVSLFPQGYEGAKEARRYVDRPYTLEKYLKDNPTAPMKE
ncbi:MAG: tetratricopeptide repeat protein [Bryobacteraceae bacterium]|nr:tetratricopeptide repeat protein [Bryobacteraceae bacterium]